MNSSIAHIICFLLLFFSSAVFCQNDQAEKSGKHSTSLGLGAGINDFHQRDKYLSPYTFNGLSLASKVIFELKTEQSRHRVDGFFSAGSLNPEIQQREIIQKGGYLSYSYVQSTGKWEFAGHPFQLLAGAGISSLVLNTDFNLTDETGYTKYDQSWYWSHSLNLVLLSEYQFSKDKCFSLQLSVPLFGFVSRPENGHRLSQNNLDVVDDNFLNAATQGKIEYLWNNPIFFTDIEYRQPISNHFDFLAAYRFSYISSNKPDSILSMGTYMNNLSVGILWKI